MNKVFISCVFFLFISFGVLQPSAEASDVVTGRDGAEMVLIPEGVFVMGSDDPYATHEKPKHDVFLDAFYIDKYEVTNEMFSRFLNDINADNRKGGRRWNWVVIRNDLDSKERARWLATEIMYRDGKYYPVKGFERYPVVTVSWFGSKEYCRGAGKRLPTEAEWEKAARGGLAQARYPWGDQMPTAYSGVIFDRKWKDGIYPAPTEAVTDQPYNGFHLYGMAGNVVEWCSDWYSDAYYKYAERENPRGPAEGSYRVLRGGSWASSFFEIRVSARASLEPGANMNTTGFRCAMAVQQ